MPDSATTYLTSRLEDFRRTLTAQAEFEESKANGGGLQPYPEAIREVIRRLRLAAEIFAAPVEPEQLTMPDNHNARKESRIDEK